VPSSPLLDPPLRKLLKFRAPEEEDIFYVVSMWISDLIHTNMFIYIIYINVFGTDPQ
jgi:hypothetical protein